MKSMEENVDIFAEESAPYGGKNLIVEKSIDFAVGIIDFCVKISGVNVRVILNQLLRSGTSIGANIHESQSAESRQDFIHKMKIAAKEADETAYWLKICQRSKTLPDPSPLDKQVIEIQKILGKIISSAKQNSK